ncbi:ABC transporter substrate-binding protein [Sphaerisporangium siamense]|uniref:Polar amino acid transport system substrate-binding protein n=1 Tax=Sphaerisporangium siamense TaxID=795645 RepID=A0A7W7D1D8_9ACTN|nr:ABC transporter substrate-binding protein [Sphaerisporangium siamense]MBB4698534.1 polar amino acid transport system substrate-binding protein [Sphaerisporangium siamense]GII85405.1 ABC transporter substrate-binding protein [Sphaerisporangium siamense]
MNTRILTTLAAGALLAATAACGGQSLDDDNTSAGTGSAAPANVVLDPAPTEEKAADVINAITPDKDLAAKAAPSLKGGVLKVVSSMGYPPMELFASDGKTAIGFDPALARAIARKLGVKVTITDEEFNSQIPGVLTGRYDFVISSMTDTPERQGQVTFVDYVRAGAGMLVKSGNPAGITGPKDLCGKTVSVVDNGSSMELAEDYAADCEKSGGKSVNVLKFPGDQEALLQVSGGRAQASLTDFVVAASKAADPKLAVDAVPLDGTESPWGIGMKPDNKVLIESVKGALDSLIQSGEYAKLLKAWNLEKLAVQSAVVNGGK